LLKAIYKRYRADFMEPGLTAVETGDLGRDPRLAKGGEHPEGDLSQQGDAAADERAEKRGLGFC
jgi:hypothetical protein